MIWSVIGLSVVLVGIGFVILGVRVLFHHTHRFPETSAGHNPAMRARGIQCPRVEEGLLHGAGGCSTCYGTARKCPRTESRS